MRRTLGRKNQTKDIKAIRALSKVTDLTIACRVYNNADFTHDSTGNWVAVTFNSERRDYTGMHSNSTNNSRITFDIAGWYLVGGHAVFDNNATGLRGVAVRVGGDTIIGSNLVTNNGASITTQLSVSALYYFSATNYVELVTYQNSGGNLDIKVYSNYSPEFWAVRMPFNDNTKTGFSIPA